MSKKVKILVSVLVAVVLLTVGGATTVMAQGKEPASTPEPSTKISMVTANTTALLARVAEKLGVSEEALTNAFRQAQQEMMEAQNIATIIETAENFHVDHWPKSS